jgi:glycosyltransferase involved in cell wall biosynthesis
MRMAKKTHRVSIGLPVFNGEKYLEQAIQCLLAQTYADFELVICDNASDDGTEAICRSYVALDDRVRYHRNPRNLGATRNFNMTFELSSGEYFRWASHDDLCAPDHLERCVAVLDSCPSVVLCYPKTMNIDSQGEVLGPYEDNLALLDPDPVERHRAFHQRFRTQVRCQPIFGLVRSEALRKTKLLGNFNSADFILLQELVLQGMIHEIPEHLFYRRIHQLISTRANRTPEAVAEWFDPANRGRIVAPLWRLVYERFGAVRNSSLTNREKVHCYAHCANWLIWWGPGLARETGEVVKTRFSRFSPLGHRSPRPT